MQESLHKPQELEVHFFQDPACSPLSFNYVPKLIKNNAVPYCDESPIKLFLDVHCDLGVVYL